MSESQEETNEEVPQDAAPSSGLSVFPAPDLEAPQLTVRAIITGMILGGILSLCNIYSGLKIGWGFNMSITAMLLSFGFYKMLETSAGARPWGMLENNTNQTAASAGANISSAGLVAGIPALTLITGEELSWALLATWTLSVSLVGIVVGLGLRRQMLEVDKLPFPNGIAAASTIKEMYAKGSEAMARLRMLLIGGGVAAAGKILIKVLGIKKLPIPGAITAKGAGAAAGKYSLYNLTWALDPSPLMVAVGVIVGIRAGLSMLLGAIIAWGVLGPIALDAGWAEVGDPSKPWFKEMATWMLWPGVSMMVTASLTSFAFSWRSIVAALKPKKKKAEGPDPKVTGDMPRKTYFTLGFVFLVFASTTQVAFFGINPITAVAAVLLTFVLAIVAGRVSGETNITPVGAMGKVTQLMFGVVHPGQAATNLMTANVTGGAASQCADMLHDLKTGLLIGASPKAQGFAQMFGVLSGALIGCAGYLLLIPNPGEMLITDEWPAPAVVTWKAVAELFQEGLEAMPPMALEAMAIGGGAGVLLAILEKVLPEGRAKWVPSPSAIGLALVIPANYAISMCLGGVISLLAHKQAPTWTKRFLIVLAAGVIAGESLAGVGIAFEQAISDFLN